MKWLFIYKFNLVLIELVFMNILNVELIYLFKLSDVLGLEV